MGQRVCQLLAILSVLSTNLFDEWKLTGFSIHLNLGSQYASRGCENSMDNPGGILYSNCVDLGFIAVRQYHAWGGWSLSLWRCLDVSAGHSRASITDDFHHD